MPKHWSFLASMTVNYRRWSANLDERKRDWQRIKQMRWVPRISEWIALKQDEWVLNVTRIKYQFVFKIIGFWATKAWSMVYRKKGLSILCLVWNICLSFRSRFKIFIFYISLFYICYILNILECFEFDKLENSVAELTSCNRNRNMVFNHNCIYFRFLCLE